MSGIFDIKPPPKKRYPEKNKAQHYERQTTKRKKSGVFLFFIVMVLGFIVFFSFINNNKTKTINPQDTNLDTRNKETTSTTSPSDNQSVNQTISSPEASISISSTPTSSESRPNVQITVLNGSGETGAANNAKNELEKNGIEVYKIDNAQNNYSQTIIYYTNENKSIADKIQETLADYNPKLIEDNTLADNENVLVVIGE